MRTLVTASVIDVGLLLSFELVFLHNNMMFNACSQSCDFCFLAFILRAYLQEVDYIPLVRDMITLQRGFDKPYAAAGAIVRQVNKPASKAKGKAKAKAKAAA